MKTIKKIIQALNEWGACGSYWKGLRMEVKDATGRIRALLNRLCQRILIALGKLLFSYFLSGLRLIGEVSINFNSFFPLCFVFK